MSLDSDGWRTEIGGGRCFFFFFVLSITVGKRGNATRREAGAALRQAQPEADEQRRGRDAEVKQGEELEEEGGSSAAGTAPVAAAAAP